MARVNPLFTLFLAGVVVVALMVFGASWDVRGPSPGWWPFITFAVGAAVLDGLRTPLRLAATGSLAFVLHLASALLFGGFWGAVVTAVSALLVNVARGKEFLKTLFNSAQLALSVLGAVYLYTLVGGDIPPAYLGPRSVLASGSVQRDLGLFFVLSASYFVINSLLVSVAVALNSERALREVWNWNTRGVLGYDLTASSLAVLVALLYAKFDQTLGFGSVALIGVVFPLIAVRHVYGLYRQLQESGQELLQLMVKAIEARDPYTSGHSVRVSLLSRTIAMELGLPAMQIEQIETAALLHDVGKIHEEFAPLLRKESRLDEAETALMQTHATRSAELVGIISKFRGSVQDSVRHHHERWDGRGYPNGVAGESIPIGARIILISDTIDAMTTDRPYRRRLTLDVVIAELQKCKGTQFDPKIVDVAISSVAVRHLIASPSPEARETQPHLARRRPAWAGASIWRTRRA
jgi:putative nucleotidyltransferase with HDIG domain